MDAVHVRHGATLFFEWAHLLLGARCWCAGLCVVVLAHVAEHVRMPLAQVQQDGAGKGRLKPGWLSTTPGA